MKFINYVINHNVNLKVGRTPIRLKFGDVPYRDKSVHC